MGVLKSYTNSSPKKGYYINDWVPGKGFVTLQTTGVAERLFDWIEFEPGDRLPQALVRAMLEVKLLWTGSSSASPDLDTDTYSLENLDSHAVRMGLSAGQYRRLVAFCRRYDGGRKAALRELERELAIEGISLSEDDYPDAQSLSERRETSTEGTAPAGYSGLHKRFFIADKHLPDVIQETIQRWGADIKNVLDNPYGPMYARAFVAYPGSVSSFECGKERTSVRIRAPHPGCLFEDAFVPGPAAELTFITSQLPARDYRNVDTKEDRQELSECGWRTFQIAMKGTYPWKETDTQLVGDTTANKSAIGDMTASVRRTKPADGTTDILHKATIQDAEVIDWETTLDVTGDYKYDTAGRTTFDELSLLEKLSIREQQLGAYRSISCLEKFVPGFSEVPDPGVLDVPDPIR